MKNRKTDRMVKKRYYIRMDILPFSNNAGESEMNTKSVSAAFTTDKVVETRDFYVRHFGARVTFDCGWYVNLEFGSPASTLQFMAATQPEHRLSDSAGLMYNFSVENVDEEHQRLTSEGLKVVMPIEDHPWGDRGFGVQDPNGITLYIYTERDPSEEFRQYYR
jgi:uncharacterized glyoxalase superfamily protein PhnB